MDSVEGHDHDIERNKRMASDFVDLAFNRKRPAEAFARYFASEWINHNPHGRTGQDVDDYFERYFAENPQASTTIGRLVAEEDLVVVHMHWRSSPDDLGRAMVDIMRVHDGKFVEHWDVIQTVTAARNPAGHAMV